MCCWLLFLYSVKSCRLALHMPADICTGGDAAVCCHSDQSDIYRSVATPVHSVDASLSPNLRAIQLTVRGVRRTTKIFTKCQWICLWIIITITAFCCPFVTLLIKVSCVYACFCFIGKFTAISNENLPKVSQ